MFSAVVWVPGRFALTNQMLDDLRAAGNYEGQAKRMGRMAKAGHDAFAAESDRVFYAAFAAWKTWKLSVARVGLSRAVAVAIYVRGHERFDPDAWYLLGKAAVDGMAKALGMSDRKAIWDVSGRVAQFGDDYYYRPPVPRLTNGDDPGFAMGIAEVSP